MVIRVQTGLSLFKMRDCEAGLEPCLLSAMAGTVRQRKTLESFGLCRDGVRILFVSNLGAAGCHLLAYRR